MYPEVKNQKSPETNLGKEVHVNAIQWNFDNEILNTLSYHVPAECIEDKQYVPPRLN